MMTDVIADAALRGQSLYVPEQVDGYKLFVRKRRPVVVTQALLFQDGLGIVEAADEQVEFDKQGFHKTILPTHRPSAFLLLIRISYVEVSWVRPHDLSHEKAVGI
jgi:hypothetical protein